MIAEFHCRLIHAMEAAGQTHSKMIKFLTINSLGDLQKAIGWPSVEKSPKQRHTPMHRELL